jgi:hypothetical protein
MEGETIMLHFLILRMDYEKLRRKSDYEKFIRQKMIV